MKFCLILCFILSFCSFYHSLKTYYVTNDSKCLLSPCDGSFETPFAGLINAFVQSSLSPDPKIVIYLLSDSYHLESTSLLTSFFITQDNINLEYVEIKPYTCTQDSCSKTVTILLKSQNFFFIVSNVMILWNIVWIGNDLPFLSLNLQNNNNTNISCLQNLSEICCRDKDMYNSSSLICNIQNLDISMRTVPDHVQGLFTFLFDNSSLSLISNEFINVVSVSKNQFSLTGYFFLFGGEALNDEVFHLTIQNSSFQSNYFIGGIINFAKTNSFHSIEIYNTIFSSYNIFKIKDINLGFNNFFIILGNGTNLIITNTTFFQNEKHIYLNSNNTLEVHELEVQSDFLNDFLVEISIIKMVNDNKLVFIDSNLSKISMMIKVDFNSLFLPSNLVETLNFKPVSVLFTGAFSNNLTFINCSIQNLKDTTFLSSFSTSTVFFVNCIFFNVSTSLNSFFEINNTQIQFMFQSVIFTNVSSSNWAPFFHLSSPSQLTFISSTFTLFENISFIYGYISNQINIFNTSISLFKGPFPLILYLQNNNYVTLIGLTVIDAHTWGLGGFLFLFQDNNLTIENALFDDISGGEGCILYAMTSNNLTLHNTVVLRSKTESGAIFSGRGYYNFFKVDNCTFFGTKTVIFNQFLGGTTQVVNSRFYNTTNDENPNIQGVVFHFENEGHLFFNDSTIKDSHSHFGLVGAIYSTQTSALYIYNTTFETLYFDSGSVLSMLTGNLIYIQKSVFKNCSATSLGGIILLKDDNFLSVSDCLFNNSYSFQLGGSIYMFTNNLMYFMTSVVRNSSSFQSGGFLFAENGNLIFTRLIIFTELGSQSGGFIFLQKNNYFLGERCFLTNLTADVGGLFYLQIMNAIYLDNIDVSNVNITSYGGVIFSFLGNEASIGFSLVNNIVCENSGAAIFIDSSNYLKLDKTQIFNVYLKNSGGAIFALLENNVTMENSNLVNFTMENGIGAFLCFLGRRIEFTMLKSNFSGLHSSQASGVFISQDRNTMIFENVRGIVGKECVLDNLFYGKSYNIMNMSYCEFELQNPNLETYFVWFLDHSQVMSNNSIVYAQSLLRGFVLDGDIFGIIRNFTLYQNKSTSGFIFLKATSRSFVTLDTFKMSPTFFLQFSIEESELYCKNFELSFMDINIMTTVNDPLLLFYIVNSKVSIIKSKFKSYLPISFIYAEFSQIKLLKCVIVNFISRNMNTTNKCIINGVGLYNSSIIYSTFISNEGVVSVDQFSGVFLLKKNLVIYNNDSCFGLNSLNTSRFISKYSTFAFNKGSNGAVNNLINFKNISIYKNKFLGNLAIGKNTSNGQNLGEGKGGVNYFKYNLVNIPSISIKNSSFIKNHAMIGGCDYLDTPFPFLFSQQNDYFKENGFTNYGEISASLISRIAFIKTYETDLNLNQNFFDTSTLQVSSGSIYDSCLLYIVGIDKFNNIIYTPQIDLTFQVEFHLLNSNTTANIITTSQQNGFICLNGPFIRSELPIKSSFEYIVTGISSNRLNSLRLTLNFRDCEVGEKLNSNLTCEPCPPQKYSLIKDFSQPSETCLPCPKAEFSCLGGTGLVPNPGYWRLNGQSTNFIQCPKSFKCLGGNLVLESLEQKHSDYSKIFNASSEVGDRIQSQAGFCSLGYTGVLCQECDLDYGATGDNCKKCRESYYSIWISFQLIVKVGLFMFNLHVALGAGINDFLGENVNNDIINTSMLKILTNYIQLLTLILSYEDFGSTVGDVLGFTLAAQPNIGEAFSIQCLLKEYKIDLNPIAFQFYISIFYWIPLVLLCCLYLIWVKKRTTRMFLLRPIIEHLKYIDLLKSSILIILFLCYFDILGTSLKLFPCQNVGDDIDSELRLLFDLSVNCRSDDIKMLKIISLLIIVGFGFGFPLLILLAISARFRHKDLFEPDGLLKYSFFFRAYEAKFFFWDILNMYRKLIVLCIQILWINYDSTQKNLSLQILFLVLVIFLFLQLRLRPYSKAQLKVINPMEQLSLIALSLTAFLILLYNNLSTSYDNQDNLMIFWIICFVLGFALNLCFCCFWLYQYIPNQKKKIKEGIIFVKQNFGKDKMTESEKKRNSFNNLMRKPSPPKPREITNCNSPLLKTEDAEETRRISLEQMDFLQVNYNSSFFKINDEYFADKIMAQNLLLFNKNSEALCHVSALEFEFTHHAINTSYFAENIFKLNQEKRLLYKNEDFHLSIVLIDDQKVSCLMRKYHLDLLKVVSSFCVMEMRFDSQHIALCADSENFTKSEKIENGLNLEVVASYKYFGHFPLPEMVLKAKIERNLIEEIKEFAIPLPINLYSFCLFEHYGETYLVNFWAKVRHLKVFTLKEPNTNLGNFDEIIDIFKFANINRSKKEISGCFSFYFLKKIRFLYRIKTQGLEKQICGKIKVILGIEIKNDHILSFEKDYLDFILDSVFANIFGVLVWRDEGEEGKLRRLDSFYSPAKS